MGRTTGKYVDDSSAFSGVSPKVILSLTDTPNQYNPSNSVEITVEQNGDPNPAIGGSTAALVFTPPSPSPVPSEDPQPTPRLVEAAGINIAPLCFSCPSVRRR